jgi:hypothetical protein
MDDRERHALLDALPVASATSIRVVGLEEALNAMHEGRTDTPTLSPLTLPPSAEGVPQNGFSEISSRDESRNFLGSKNPRWRLKALPAHEPPARVCEVEVAADSERKVLYALMPSRVVGDRRLNYTDLRVLLALTCYTSAAYAICYPNRSTLARRIGIAPTAVSRSMTRLRQFGYVRRLEPIGRKYPGAHSRGGRWQVLIRGNDPLPPKEKVWAR